MKKTLLVCTLIFNLNLFAQNTSEKESSEDYGIYISGGYHVGLWALLLNREIKAKELPYNVHIDKTLSKKHLIGLGYSHDTFEGNPTQGNWHQNKSIRQNVRLRYYKFLSDPQKNFSTYLGVAAGVSRWTSLNQDTEGSIELAPTAQFLFGIKVKVADFLFWQTEFGAGPPYALQSSIGIKF